MVTLQSDFGVEMADFSMFSCCPFDAQALDVVSCSKSENLQELVERVCLEVALACWDQWAPWDQDVGSA